MSLKRSNILLTQYKSNICSCKSKYKSKYVSKHLNLNKSKIWQNVYIEY